MKNNQGLLMLEVSELKYFPAVATARKIVHALSKMEREGVGIN